MKNMLFAISMFQLWVICQLVHSQNDRYKLVFRLSVGERKLSFRQFARQSLKWLTSQQILNTATTAGWMNIHFWGLWIWCLILHCHKMKDWQMKPFLSILPVNLRPWMWTSKAKHVLYYLNSFIPLACDKNVGFCTRKLTLEVENNLPYITLWAGVTEKHLVWLSFWTACNQSGDSEQLNSCTWYGFSVMVLSLILCKRLLSL